MNIRNIYLISKREFITQVKKKAFIILTILAPILMIGFGIFISFLLKANEKQYTLQVIDRSGYFQNKLKNNDEIIYNFIDQNESNSSLINKNLKDHPEVDAALVIPPLVNQNFNEWEKQIKLIINSKMGVSAKLKIENDLSEIIKKLKFEKLKINQNTIEIIEKEFKLYSINLNNETTEDTDLDFSVKYILGMVLMYAVFMFIVIYGVRVMRSVLEEKNNRVVEIIISSVPPFDLMLGKILGVTMVALTQFLVWITMAVSGALFLKSGLSNIKNQIPVSNSDALDKVNLAEKATQISNILLNMNVPLVVFVFLFYFLLGYIFYSAMYAAIGSAVDNETETQQFTLFAIIPLLMGVYGNFTIINNPDGPMGFWLSIIPLTSPVSMVARIPFGVPTWEIVLSIFLLICTTLFMIYLAAKVYRIGILSYGNKITYRELWKWIKN